MAMTEAELEKVAWLEPLTEEQANNKPQGFYYPKNAIVYYGAGGLIFHRVLRGTEGGTVMEVERPLAKTREEARENRWDFYDPQLGLIWEGYKLASDRSPQDRIKDTSETILRPGSRPLSE